MNTRFRKCSTPRARSPPRSWNPCSARCRARASRCGGASRRRAAWRRSRPTCAAWNSRAPRSTANAVARPRRRSARRSPRTRGSPAHRRRCAPRKPGASNTGTMPRPTSVRWRPAGGRWRWCRCRRRRRSPSATCCAWMASWTRPRSISTPPATHRRSRRWRMSASARWRQRVAMSQGHAGSSTGRWRWRRRTRGFTPRPATRRIATASGGRAARLPPRAGVEPTTRQLNTSVLHCWRRGRRGFTRLRAVDRDHAQRRRAGELRAPARPGRRTRAVVALYRRALELDPTIHQLGNLAAACAPSAPHGGVRAAYMRRSRRAPLPVHHRGDGYAQAAGLVLRQPRQA